MYKYKYYWKDGHTTFIPLSWQSSAKVFLTASKLFGEYNDLTKIDVYKDDKLIATFHK